MPFLECPNCGELYHVRVADVEEWYKEKYPNLKFGDTPKELCRGCWMPLKVGDSVYLIREKPARENLPEDLGIIIEKATGEENQIKFIVKFADDRIETLTREKLYYK